MNPEYRVILDYIKGEITIEKAFMFIFSMHQGVIPYDVIDLLAAISNLKVRRCAFDIEEKDREERSIRAARAVNNPGLKSRAC